MVIRKGKTFLLLGLALSLVSCVPQKAVVVEAAPAPPKKVEKTPEPVPSEEIPLPMGDITNDGIRMGEMLEMPTERDFRPTNPTAKPGDSGGIISRPPTDPPSRVKPADDEPKAE